MAENTPGGHAPAASTCSPPPRRLRLHLWVLMSLLIFLGVTLVAPLAWVVHTAAGPADTSAGLPLLRSFLHSLALAGTVAVVGSLLALCTAVTAQSLGPRGRHLLDVVVCVPVAVPPGALAASVLATAGNAGWLPHPGRISAVHGLFGMVWAMLVMLVPLAHLLCRAALRTLDPRTLEGAAISGASPLRVLRAVVLPHVTPAVVIGATVLLVAAMSDPAVPAVLRGRTPNLAHLALDTTAGWGQDAVAARAALLLATPALLLVPALLLFRTRFSTAWEPGARSARLDLPAGAVRAAVLVPTLIHVLVCLAALVTLFVQTLPLLFGAHRWRALGEALGVSLSTLGLSVLACLIALPLAAGSVWLQRHPTRHIPRPAQLLLLLAVLPGTTVGICFSLAARVPRSLGPLHLPALVGGASPTGGVLGILLMLMTIALPVLYVGVRALWDAVPRAVRDSARVSGVGQRALLLVVVLPSAGVLSAALAAVAVGRCMVSVVPLAYVTSPDTALVVSRVLDLTDHSRTPEACLVGLLTAVLTALLFTLTQAVVAHLLPRLGGAPPR